MHLWKYPLNGDTVLTIQADGSAIIRHEYVDAAHLLTEDDQK